MNELEVLLREYRRVRLEKLSETLGKVQVQPNCETILRAPFWSVTCRAPVPVLGIAFLFLQSVAGKSPLAQAWFGKNVAFVEDGRRLRHCVRRGARLLAASPAAQCLWQLGSLLDSALPRRDDSKRSPTHSAAQLGCMLLFVLLVAAWPHRTLVPSPARS